MNRDHEPSPDFLAKLEWQVRTSLQRQTRFSEPVRQRNGGTMKLATVILVSALFGAGGVVVKDEVQEGRAQEILLAQSEMEIRLAELQVEMVRSDLDEVERRVAEGTVEEEALLAGRAALGRAAAYLRRLQLDRDEILATGREPRDDVSAPLAKGRDFVTERLELEVQVAGEQVRLASHDLARVQELVAQGLVRSDEAEFGVAGAVRQSRLRVDALQQRIDLRRRFLEGDVTALEAASQALIIEATADLDTQTHEVDQVRRVLADLEERAAQGLVGEPEVRRARLELQRRELARKLAELKLQQIRGGGGEG